MKTINSKQYFSLIILFIFGSFILTHGNRLAKQDTWIAILYGFLLAIPYILIVAYICSKNKGLNAYEIFKRYFGKYISKIFSLFFILTTLTLAIFICGVFIEYVHLTSLQQTPQYIIGFLLIIISIYAALQNMQVIGRISSFLFIIFISTFLVVCIFSFTNVNIENMMPIHHLEGSEMFKATYDSFLNPFSEVFIFLVFGKYLKKEQSQYKVLIISLLLATIFLSLNALRNVLILGSPAYFDLYFPSYISNTILISGAIIERIELLFSFFFIFCLFIKLTLCLKATTIGITYHFKKLNMKYVTFFLGFITLLITCTYFKNIDHYFGITYSPFREYINFGLMFIIFLTFIFTLINRKKYVNSYDLTLNK